MMTTSTPPFLPGHRYRRRDGSEVELRRNTDAGGHGQMAGWPFISGPPQNPVLYRNDGTSHRGNTKAFDLLPGCLCCPVKEVESVTPARDWVVDRRNKSSGKSRSGVICEGLTEYVAKTLANDANKGSPTFIYRAYQKGAEPWKTK